MRRVFADSGYWIALINRTDQLHSVALSISRTLQGCRLVTTEMVLVEVLDSLASQGAPIRRAAAAAVDQLFRNPTVDVVPQWSAGFAAALQRYRRRLDQGWGLTDCASFLVMEDQDIADALAHDHHFEQAGFRALMRG
jgi:uncharacterized protein